MLGPDYTIGIGSQNVHCGTTENSSRYHRIFPEVQAICRIQREQKKYCDAKVVVIQASVQMTALEGCVLVCFSYFC